MAIQDEFTIYPYTKTVRHTSGTTVWTMIQFYSWMMDTFDEPGYMTYARPLKYNTPTSYTMLNGWFIDNGDGSNALNYLTGGGIDSSGYTDDVHYITGDNLTDFVSGDKDIIIYNSTHTEDFGPLLAYKNDSPISGEGAIWVRDTESAANPIQNNDVVNATQNGGTGVITANADEASGDEVYANLYTIADFPGSPDPQVYIFQDGERIAEWSGLTNWDRGTIDILIPVKLGGVEIDNGNIDIFARQAGDSFTFAEADLTAGGRTPVAMETQVDINETTGEWYLLYDNSNAGSFSIADVVNNGPAAGAPPTFYAEVVAVTEFASTTEGVLTLRGLNGTINDNDDLYVVGVLEGKANGKPGDTYLSYSAGTDPVPGDIDLPFEGGTSDAERVLVGYDTTEKKLVMQVYHTHGTLDSQDYTGDGRRPLYLDFESAEVVDAPAAGTGSMSVTTDSVSTTLVSGFSNITLAHINGDVSHAGTTGTFTPGEVVNYDGGSSHAIVVYDNGTNQITLANVESPDTLNGDTITGEMSGATCVAGSELTDTNPPTEDFNFDQQAAYSYSVFVECGAIYNATSEGRAISDVYEYLKYLVQDGSTRTMYTSSGTAIVLLDGEEYIKAFSTYTAVKAAPFGTLAGGVFFGAQGVWVEGMASSDANNIKLVDHGGTLREPYAEVTLTVGNTVAGDSVAVYKKHASLDIPDKAQFTSGTNTLSASTFDQNDAGGGFPIDTPSDGTFVVVAADENEEHRYRYASWNNTGGTGDDGQLVLAAEVTGTAETGSTGQTLIDTGVFASGVQRGDIIRNTTDASWGYIETVDSNDQVTTTQMRDSAGAVVDWAQGDGFEINSLVQNYDGSDLFFIPYIDETAAGGSVTKNILYDQVRNVLIRVRDVDSTPPIQPYVATSSIGTGGMNVSTIRNEDEVYT
jgi:hypothetical protein